MKRMTLLTFALCLAMVISLSVPVTKSSYTSAQRTGSNQVDGLTPEKIKELKTQSRAIRRVRDMLVSHNIPLEAYDLFAFNWKQKLSAAFEQIPEMRQNHQVPLTKIRGVGIANEITLPEQITLTGDTVIIARKLIFEGKNVKIKGPHNLHLFVTGPIETTEKGGSISIDVSGMGRREWMESQKKPQPAVLSKMSAQPQFLNASYSPARAMMQDISGADGSNGTFGSNGSDGSNGSGGSAGADKDCHDLIKDGGNGTNGANGGNGSLGGNGGNGGDGGDAGYATVFADQYSGFLSITANGGDGGYGGDGGRGGDGGWGGNGGRGGNGASACKCVSIGSGGNGGGGGNAGSAAGGGNGGNGGDGGDGGTVIVRYTSGWSPANASVTVAAGQAGEAGSGGFAGTIKSPGAGGAKGLGGIGSGGCTLPDGQYGAGGAPGSTAFGGEDGEEGEAGMDGTYAAIPMDNGGGTILQGGGWGNNCTEYYWVTWHCVPILDRGTSTGNDKINYRKTSFGFTTKTNFSSASFTLSDNYLCTITDVQYAGCW